MPRSARGHAEQARDLLAALEATEAKVGDLTEDQRLQMYVSGGFTRLNKDVEHSVQVAIASALTSIALTLTGGLFSDALDQVRRHR